jgi:hypothetical protein
MKLEKTLYHIEELHNFCCSPSIIRMINLRRMRWAGHVARMGRRGMHVGFWWETRRKETTRKARRRWKVNIKMDLREIGWGGMD